MKRDAGHQFGSDTSREFPVLFPVKREFRNPNLPVRTPTTNANTPSFGKTLQQLHVLLHMRSQVSFARTF